MDANENRNEMSKRSKITLCAALLGMLLMAMASVFYCRAANADRERANAADRRNEALIGQVEGLITENTDLGQLVDKMKKLLIEAGQEIEGQRETIKGQKSKIDEAQRKHDDDQRTINYVSKLLAEAKNDPPAPPLAPPPPPPLDNAAVIEGMHARSKDWRPPTGAVDPVNGGASNHAGSDR